MFMTGSVAEIAAAESEVAQLRQLAAVEKVRAEDLAGLNPQLRVDAAEARKAAAEVSLKQAEKAVRDCLVTAPENGTVLRVQVSVGESIIPSGMHPAIVFRPDGPLVVRAEIDQEFLGRVLPGMEAKVTDDVRPDAPVWKGKVERIGNWVARRRAIVLEPNEMNDVRTVECVVALEGNPEGMLIGQRVRVRIAREGK
jgi:multidrug resistance efflux pump